MWRKLMWVAALSGSAFAQAEQYVLKTDFAPDRPATVRLLLNGQLLALHHNTDGDLDITSRLKKGKNTLVMEWTPGSSRNRFATTVMTLGAGTGAKWNTLFKREINPDTKAGKASFTFMAQPSPVTKSTRGNVVLSADLHPDRTVEFEVTLNEEVIANINSDGNTNLTPLLKSGKNVVTVKYIMAKKANPLATSRVTIGQQEGNKWNSIVKWGLSEYDQNSGSFTFPIYR